MGLTASERGSSQEPFAMVPEGQYIARCYRILDLGTQTTTGQFGTKEQHKVMISWELLDDKVFMEDGRPFAISQFYTVSLHEKAKLRADLESWRGRKFTIEELTAFDLAGVLGAYCQIQVVHDETGKYANVQTIMAYKGDKPKAVNPDTVFNLDEPDMAVFDKLSDNMKLKITSTPEWAALQAKQQKTEAGGFSDEDYRSLSDGLAADGLSQEELDSIPF